MPEASTQIIIGTRGSPLALWQANAVKSALEKQSFSTPLQGQIEIIKTTGDRIQDRALLEAGGKGLFTKELDEALLEGRIQIAVHSAKDMPTRLPEELEIAGYLPRADVRDAFIGKQSTSWSNLPQGAHIGTASLRREALIRRLRPDVRVSILRGNVETRLQKVAQGEFDGTFLAVAGLTRLGLHDKITDYLPLDTFPPAVGQGAVAIVARKNTPQIKTWLKEILDRPTSIALSAERAFLRALDGSCRTPIAGYAVVKEDQLYFHGLVASKDGQACFEVHKQANWNDAEALGLACAETLREKGGEAFFASLRALS